MSVAVRLSEEIVAEAQKHAQLNLRTVPKQIEYWSRLGKIAEENPDLPFSFIKEVLEARLEVDRGEATPFEFREE